MKKLFLVTTLACITGCSHLASVTEKTTTDPKTGIVVSEYTRAHVTCFFDSKSDLAKFRNTTGVTGTNGFTYPAGTSIGSLNQESSGSNAVNLIEAVTSAAVQAAIKATVKP